MTQKDFYKAVAEGNITAEVQDYAQERYTKLSQPTAKQKENEALKTQILEYLGEVGKPVISTDLAGEMNVSTSKITGLCGVLIKEGKIAVTDVVLPKIGSRKAYSLA